MPLTNINGFALKSAEVAAIVQIIDAVINEGGGLGGGGGGGFTSLTGDVTGAGSGAVATTIANDAVTYAKMQNVTATARVLGRKTAGAGNVEELTGADILTLTGTPPVAFTGLTDVVAVYAAHAGRPPVVNAAADGLILIPDSPINLINTGSNGINISVVDGDIQITASGTGTINLSGADDTFVDTAGELDLVAGTLLYLNGTSIELDGPVAADNVLCWKKLSLDFSDFSAAATSNSLNLYLLPIGAVVHQVKTKASTAFAGGTITAYTIEVGIGSGADSDKYAAAFDVFSAVAADNFQLSTTVNTEGPATQLTITAKSTGDTLDNATAGVVDVWLLISVPV